MRMNRNSNCYLQFEYQKYVINDTFQIFSSPLHDLIFSVTFYSFFLSNNPLFHTKCLLFYITKYSIQWYGVLLCRICQCVEVLENMKYTCEEVDDSMAVSWYYFGCLDLIMEAG